MEWMISTRENRTPLHRLPQLQVESSRAQSDLLATVVDAVVKRFKDEVDAPWSC
jgi:hypothetical protein